MKKENIKSEELIEICEQVCKILKLRYGFKYAENLLYFKHTENDYIFYINMNNWIFNPDIKTSVNTIVHHIKNDYCIRFLLQD